MAETISKQIENETTAWRKDNLAGINPISLSVLKAFLNETNDDTKIVISKFGISMTVKSLCCLKKKKWLNDEIINFYMGMLSERHAEYKSINGGRGQFFFSSYFMSNLIDRGYDGVSRWTKNVKIFELDKVFVPININNFHWVLAVVHIQEKVIEYVDSMKYGYGKSYCQALSMWLAKEAKKSSVPFKNSEWMSWRQNEFYPTQDNGYDCGLYVVVSADVISLQLPLDMSFNASHMPHLRKLVGVNILRGTLCSQSSVFVDISRDNELMYCVDEDTCDNVNGASSSISEELKELAEKIKESVASYGKLLSDANYYSDNDDDIKEAIRLSLLETSDSFHRTFTVDTATEDEVGEQTVGGKGNTESQSMDVYDDEDDDQAGSTSMVTEQKDGDDSKEKAEETFEEVDEEKGHNTGSGNENEDEDEEDADAKSDEDEVMDAEEKEGDNTGSGNENGDEDEEDADAKSDEDEEEVKKDADADEGKVDTGSGTGDEDDEDENNNPMKIKEVTKSFTDDSDDDSDAKNNPRLANHDFKKKKRSRI